MASQVGEIEGRMGLDISGLQKAKRKAARSLGDLEDKASKHATSIKAAGTAVAAGTAAAGAAAVKVGTDSAKAYAEFEAAVEDAGAKAQATSAEVDMMADAAIRAGQESLHSASKSADAMGFLAQAGLDARQQIEALPGALQLATAGELELSNAADIATDAMSGLGLEVSELGRVNDVLVKTANSANTSVGQLGQGISEAAPLAASAGISIEQLSAILGKLASAGIKGAKGGTAVKTALASLSKPSDQAKAALNRVGIAAEDIQPILAEEGLTGILERIDERSKNAGRTLTTVFGKEAGPRLQALLQQGTGSVRELRRELDNAGGTAENVANTKIDTLSGQLEIMQGSVETAKVALGEELEPVATSAAQAVTEVANDVTEMTRSEEGASETTQQLAQDVGNLTRNAGKLGTTLGRTVVPWLTKVTSANLNFADTTIRSIEHVSGVNEMSKEAEKGLSRYAETLSWGETVTHQFSGTSEALRGNLDLLGQGTEEVHKLQMKLNETVEEHGLESEEAAAVAKKLEQAYRQQGKSITKVAADWEGMRDAIAETTQEALSDETLAFLDQAADKASGAWSTLKDVAGEAKQEFMEAAKANEEASDKGPDGDGDGQEPAGSTGPTLAELKNSRKLSQVNARIAEAQREGNKLAELQAKRQKVRLKRDREIQKIKAKDLRTDKELEAIAKAKNDAASRLADLEKKMNKTGEERSSKLQEQLRLRRQNAEAAKQEMESAGSGRSRERRSADLRVEASDQAVSKAELDLMKQRSLQNQKALVESKKLNAQARARQAFLEGEISKRQMVIRQQKASAEAEQEIDRAVRQTATEIESGIGKVQSVTSELLGAAGAGDQLTSSLEGAFSVAQGISQLSVLGSASNPFTAGLAAIGTVIGGVSQMTGGGQDGGDDDSAQMEQRRRKRDKRLAELIGKEVGENVGRTRETIFVEDNNTRRSNRDPSRQETREQGRRLARENKLNPGGV